MITAPGITSLRVESHHPGGLAVRVFGLVDLLMGCRADGCAVNSHCASSQLRQDTAVSPGLRPSLRLWNTTRKKWPHNWKLPCGGWEFLEVRLSLHPCSSPQYVQCLTSLKESSTDCELWKNMCKMSRSCCEVLVEAGLAICCINQQAAWWSSHVTKCNLGRCWCFHKPFRQLAHIFMMGLHYSDACSQGWTVCVCVSVRTGASPTKTLAIFPLTFDLWLTSCSVNTACSSWLCESAQLRACSECERWVSVCESRVACGGRLMASWSETQSLRASVIGCRASTAFLCAYSYSSLELLNILVLAVVHPSSSCFSL